MLSKDECNELHDIIQMIMSFGLGDLRINNQFIYCNRHGIDVLDDQPWGYTDNEILFNHDGNKYISCFNLVNCTIYSLRVGIYYETIITTETQCLLRHIYNQMTELISFNQLELDARPKIE